MFEPRLPAATNEDGSPERRASDPSRTRIQQRDSTAIPECDAGRTVIEMSRNHSFEVHTHELGPYDTLTELHRELSNHTSTFANIVFEREDEVVVSISHSIVVINGKLFVSAVTTTDVSTDS